MDIPITIPFRGRALQATRAPKHGECDLSLLEGLVFILRAKQDQIVAAEAVGDEGCSVIVARACRVANDAVNQILARVPMAAESIQALPVEITTGKDEDRVEACIEWLGGLRKAIGVGIADMGKS